MSPPEVQRLKEPVTAPPFFQGEAGARLSPQFPRSEVVTPWRIVDGKRGVKENRKVRMGMRIDESRAYDKILCIDLLLCANPRKPAYSRILPFLIPISAVVAGFPVPSTILPFLMAISNPMTPQPLRLQGE